MSEGSQKQWFAVDVTASPTAAEAVQYAFDQLGSIGTEISDFPKDKPDVCVVGYFEQLPDGALIKDRMDDALEIYDLARGSIVSTRTRNVPETDWLAEWKKHWRPTTVGKFVIAPPWSDVPQTDKVVIRIEPNMAFGTGTHETTQLCLEAISEHFRDGMSLLDVGTGTGILAIAAAKLVPASVITACDTDADSVKIARENAAANGVADRIVFLDGSISAATPQHDFVCANLTLGVIAPLLPLLTAKVSAVLLLSGILAEQEAAIRDELSKFQISNFKFEYAGEWLSVLIE